MKTLKIIASCFVFLSFTQVNAQEEGQKMEGQAVRKELNMQEMKLVRQTVEPVAQPVESNTEKEGVETAPIQTEEPKKAQPEKQKAVPK